MIQKVTEEEEEGEDGAEDSIEEAEVVTEEEEAEHNGRSEEEANQDTGVDDQDMEEMDTVQIALPEPSQLSSEATDFEPTSSKPKTAELKAKRIEKIQQDVTSGGVSGELMNLLVS